MNFWLHTSAVIIIVVGAVAGYTMHGIELSLVVVVQGALFWWAFSYVRGLILDAVARRSTTSD